MGTVINQDAGGIMARHLFLAVLGVPPLLSGIILVGYYAKLYSAEIGLSLAAVSSSIVFAALIWITAKALGKMNTQWQQVEEQRQSEARFRSLTTATSQIIWSTSADGRVLEDSPSWRAYTGQALEEYQEFGWLDALHPDDRDYAAQVWKQAVATKSLYKVEYRLRTTNGDYRYVFACGVPVLAKDGSIQGWIGTCTDIHDRKQAEAALQMSEAQLRQKASDLEQTLVTLQRTQTQLVQSEKMSSLGQLVAGVAHEINNPVNFIYGNLTHAGAYIQDLTRLLKLYQQQFPHSTPEIEAEAEAIDLDFLLTDLPKLLASMKVGADRIQKIVLSLRNFSRMDEAEMKGVNIHEGIDSTLMILQNRLKAKAEHPEIQVIKEYGDLPLVECYAGQLNQVFMNIISNALDALEERDQARTLQEIKQQPSQIRICTEKLDSGWIRIRLIDNGPGISEAARLQLFNPFFTTKAIGKGTGLGMSISYQILTEKHGGKLHCNSQPGQGAEFVIEIPLRQP